MLKYTVLLFSAFFIVDKLAIASDPYCSNALCPGGAPHIACGNNGEFSSNCPNNAKMVNFDFFLQGVVFDYHNMHRDNIAGGYVAGYGSALKMRTMHWDDELAEIASLQAKTCQTQSTHCRNTPQFSRSGQNIGMISYTGPEERISDWELFERIFTSWWNQYKNGTMAMMNNYPQNRPVPRFALLANENNIAVGCGAVRYKKNSRNYFQLVCNYATANIAGKPVYTAGPATQGCVSPNPLFINLCGGQEPELDL